MQITVNILSQNSIDKAVQRLTEYTEKLEDKCKRLIEELLKIGVNVAEMKIGESPIGKYVFVKTEISSDEMGCNGILLADGAIKESDGFAPFSTLLAIEFGAGIHYNKTENPNANEFGFGVGTFPGQIHAFQEKGWMFWDEEKKVWRHTYGVKATMPMYFSSTEILKKVVEVAKDIFS